MKRGCLFLLFVWIGSAVGLALAASGREPEIPSFVPILLGLGISLVVAQVMGIGYALQKWMATRRDPQSWKDGQFVALSGRLQTIGKPLKSPLSGRPMAILEYEVTPHADSGKNASTMAHFQGFHMAPCGLQGPRGTVRLHGFPLLSAFPKEALDADVAPETDPALRFAEYLQHTKPQELPGNPLTLLQELTKVLGDEDGDVRADFFNSKAPFSAAEFGEGNATHRDKSTDGRVDTRSDAEEQLPGTGDEEDGEEEIEPNYEKETNLAVRLQERGYTFSEQYVPIGQEVAAFGTYRAKHRAIDVGSAFKFVHHTLRPGSVGDVVRSEFMKSIIGLVVFSAMTFAGLAATFSEVRSFGFEQWEKVREDF